MNDLVKPAVLVVGGTGVMGRAVVDELTRAGTAVRVMTRRPRAANEIAAMGAEVVEGDLIRRDSLRSACEGIGAVISAAHSLLGRGRYSTEHVDGTGQRALIDAAEEAGASHFVLTSIHDGGEAWRSLRFVKVKYQTEDYLRSRSIGWTILRPTAFMTPHAHVFIGRPVVRGQPLLLFGSGNARRNFVAPEDVARVAVRALSDPAMRGRVLDVAGAENLTDHEVVRIYETIGGRKATPWHLPSGLASGLSALIRPLHPGVGDVLRMTALAQRSGQEYHGAPYREQFGVEPLRLKEWAEARAAVELGDGAGAR